jgi:hypothetical protein
MYNMLLPKQPFLYYKKENHYIIGEVKRDVSLFGDSTKCRTCCFLTDAADHMIHASTVHMYIHTK